MNTFNDILDLDKLKKLEIRCNFLFYGPSGIYRMYDWVFVGYNQIHSNLFCLYFEQQNKDSFFKKKVAFRKDFNKMEWEVIE